MLLTILPDPLAVCRLAADAVPAWLPAHGFVSVTRTADEFSVVCSEGAVPPGVVCERGWRCLAVAGPLDFGLTGVLASIATPLAAAAISIFALSTFDTDYVLVKADTLDAAVDALRRAGHEVEPLTS
ncbi:MAG: ACT domain-containing protein [Gemmatimonadetes bacterium]|nr:ACT domain-containing protein [Gemmatimonadota bacterium]